MRRKFNRLCLITLLYAVGVGLFFAEDVMLPFKVAYPVLVLALSLFRLRRKELFPIGVALLASSVGDAMGAKGFFIPQMLFFAFAHGAYTRYFLTRAKPAFRFIPCVIAGVLLAFLFVFILPEVPDPVERVGVGVYGVVIAAMLYSVLQFGGAYAAWFRAAALLFVFSDALIAWNRFVAPVPCRTYVVMITYYSAQYLFYRFAVVRSVTRQA